VLTGALWNDDLAKAVATRDSRRDVLIARIDDEAKKVVRAIEWIDQHRVTISGNEVLKAARDFARFSQVFRFSKQDAPVALISWPTNQYPRRADNFATYANFSEALIEVLLNVNRECSVRVAVSLHPTLVHTEVYRSIEEAGLYVIDAPLIEVIDCADLFVACVSSTIFWAVQLNIPTVNIDFYDYHYSEFDEAGCETVFNLSAFESELRRLLTDPAHLEALQTRMRVNADYWTMGDGRSAERIVEAIVARMSPDSTQSVLSP
jgi:hypothetical protein